MPYLELRFLKRLYRYVVPSGSLVFAFLNGIALALATIIGLKIGTERPQHTVDQDGALQNMSDQSTLFATHPAQFQRH